MQNLIKILIPLGLNDKQAKVYLAAVSLGDCLISELAKKSNINRITTYDIVEKLEDKKIIKTYTRKRMKYVSAITPQTLLDNYRNYLEDLENSLSEFPAPNKKSTENTIEINEDKSSVDKIIKEIQAYDKPTKIICNTENFSKIKNNYINILEKINSKHRLTILTDTQLPSGALTPTIVSSDTIPVMKTSVIIIQNPHLYIIEPTESGATTTKVNNRALSETYNHLFTYHAQNRHHSPINPSQIKTALLKKLDETEPPKVDKEEEKVDNMTLF
ncbi:hypothetical protein CVV38_03810 [Candidatus Peregrinibacteria bacterium HGW-Peregrinibacteria-1]|jgi:sugar-specific transcriptional regulator TrmB|nr:MAG: hypothetical protein CVV38_03810 [Candidatus Peregrinibacteria bacterium HGW-Peregrinibacteria-1]